MRRMIGVLLAAVTAGCGGPSALLNDSRAEAVRDDAVAPTTANAPIAVASAEAFPPLAANGFGTIVIGQRPVEAVGFALRDDGSYDDHCRIYIAAGYPSLYVLVEDGVVRRVTVHGEKPDAARIATAKGIRVGSSEADVRAAYVPVGTQLHKYSDPPAKNLYYGEEGDPNALRFEIGTNGRVEAIHVGASPQLQYVEGCS